MLNLEKEYKNIKTDLDYKDEDDNVLKKIYRAKLCTLIDGLNKKVCNTSDFIDFWETIRNIADDEELIYMSQLVGFKVTQEHFLPLLKNWYKRNKNYTMTAITASLFLHKDKYIIKDCISKVFESYSDYYYLYWIFYFYLYWYGDSKIAKLLKRIY